MTLARYLDIKQRLSVAMYKDQAEMTPAELLTDYFRPGQWINGAIAEIGAKDYAEYQDIDPDTAVITRGGAEQGIEDVA